MLKRTPTAFGLSVKTRLLEWLIAECKAKTGMYVDSSTMYKLLTGQLDSVRLKMAIREILQLSDEKARF